MADGCGVSGHRAGCLCDVVLDGSRVPIADQSRMLGWMARCGRNPDDDPKGYWDYMTNLVVAREQFKMREQLGIGVDEGPPPYTDRVLICQCYLQGGGSTVPLVGDDEQCQISLGPGFTWWTVCDTFTAHNTRGESPIWKWQVWDWKHLEKHLPGETMKSQRGLAADLHVSLSTIQRLKRWYGYAA